MKLRIIVCILAFVIITGWSGKSESTQAFGYDDAVDAAIRNCHDLKLSELDIIISQASLQRAYSAFYPSFKTQWNTEYVKDLTDGLQQTTAVGTTIIPPNTAYQSALQLSGSFNLFDFGATTKRVSIARVDVEAKRKIHARTLRDLKVKVLKIYADLSTGIADLKTKRELLGLYKDIALAKERLYDAGKISRLELADDALRAIKMIDEVEKMKLDVARLTKDLGFYTGQQYDVDGLVLYELLEPNDSENKKFNIEKTPDAEIYNLEIRKKAEELSALKRDLFPRLSLYSSYVWFGSSSNDMQSSAQYVTPRNYTVGMAIILPLFEGFKSQADIKKAQLELNRLKIEKARALEDLSVRYEKLLDARTIYAASVAAQKDMLQKVEEKLAMADRLRRQELMDWTDFLIQKIDLLGQKLELTKTVIKKIASAKELEIMSETFK